MLSAFRTLFPLFAIFILVCLLALIFPHFLVNNHIDRWVVLGANTLLFLLSILSFFIQKKGLHNKNPNVFVRSVMSGMMLKMLFCVAAVILYVYASGSGFSKRAIILSLFLYLFYLSAEVFIVSKMNKQQHV